MKELENRISKFLESLPVEDNMSNLPGAVLSLEGGLARPINAGNCNNTTSCAGSYNGGDCVNVSPCGGDTYNHGSCSVIPSQPTNTGNCPSSVHICQ